MPIPIPNKIAWEVRGYGLEVPSDALFAFRDAAGNIVSFVGNDGTYHGPVADLPVATGANINHVQAEVDFGFASGGEGDLARTTVSAPWVTADSKIFCIPVMEATPEHDPEDVVLEGIQAHAENLVPGVGFDIVAYAPDGAFGRYVIRASGL